MLPDSSNPQHLEGALHRIGEVDESDGIAPNLPKQQENDRFVWEGQHYIGGIDGAVLEPRIAG